MTNPWGFKPGESLPKEACDPGRAVIKRRKLERVTLGQNFSQQEWIEAHEDQIRRAIKRERKGAK